jgi:AcrR family transcriptional regulator
MMKRAAKVGSRREQKKRDKRIRILKAARKLFDERGYDGLKARDVAKIAGVAYGTVFLYAKNKRDLISLIGQERYEAMAERAFARRPLNTPILTELMAVFREYFRHHDQNHATSREILREMHFHDRIEPRNYVEQFLSTIFERFVAIIRKAQKQGQLKASLDECQVARLLFGIYQIEVRRWLESDHVDMRKGLAQLRIMFKMVLEGIEPR